MSLKINIHELIYENTIILSRSLDCYGIRFDNKVNNQRTYT